MLPNFVRLRVIDLVFDPFCFLREGCQASCQVFQLSLRTCLAHRDLPSPCDCTVIDMLTGQTLGQGTRASLGHVALVAAWPDEPAADGRLQGSWPLPNRRREWRARLRRRTETST